MILNSFFLGQRSSLPITFVFLSWLSSIARLALIGLLLSITGQTLLFGLALLLFSFLFISLPRLFNCHRACCSLPHIVCFFLNLQIQLWIITWSIFWVYKSVSIVRKSLIYQFWFKAHSIAMLLNSGPFIAILNLLLFLFLPHFPQLSFPLFNWQLYNIKSVF